MDEQPRFTAFLGPRLIAAGPLAEVAPKAQRALERPEHAPLLVFDDATGATVELDLRGSTSDLLARLTAQQAKPAAPRGPGRPKLGVVAREVTLLPHHWDWLNAQPGGASVTLRKLVEQARRANEGADRTRVARERVYRFISVMAGNAPDFEEATRALFAGHREKFELYMKKWPKDVRTHALALGGAAFDRRKRDA